MVTNNYNNGDVFRSDFEKTIYKQLKENRTEFYAFFVVVKCKLDNDDIYISVEGDEVGVPSYRFDDCGWVCYRYCKSKKIRDYIFHRAVLRDIKLDSSSIVSNITITIFSKYKTMTAKHRLQQPRTILETRFLKHIKK